MKTDATREKRWRTIASSIKRAIQRGDLTSGSRIASQIDIAEQWNVSPMTAHRALTDLQREGWVVRRPKIGTVVADRSARPLMKIGLVFTTLSDEPQSGYLGGIENSLREGYQLLPFHTNSRPEIEAACLERAGAECDAIICYASGDPANTPMINKLAENIPIVFVDRLPEGANADIIATDNQSSITQGLRHVYTLGHRRIAYLMEDNLQISAVRERRAGYVEFMIDKGLDASRWLRTLDPIVPRDTYYQRVETIVVEMLSESEPVTAIACQQAVTMAAVLESCTRLGVSAPEELAILGFNDHSVGHQPLARNAHRIVQRSAEMGHMAAQRIEHRLINPGIPPQQTRVMADFFPAQPYVPTPAAAEFIAKNRLKQTNSDILGPA